MRKFLGKVSFLSKLMAAENAPDDFLGRVLLPGAEISGRVVKSGRYVRIKRAFSFMGPGAMVAVGYMDPGNWETDLQGGAAFGFSLLWVVVLSSLMAIVLQCLCARLGIGSGRNLAEACRVWLPGWCNAVLWILCEIAIIACDLAEVIGTAVAFNLLFGWSLMVGAIISVFDVFVILLLMRWRYRSVEAFVTLLLGTIAVCFGIELFVAHPAWTEVAKGLIPQMPTLRNPHALYLAMGIVGATIMPHNLYLHSALVQTRSYPRTVSGKQEALRWSNLDITLSLILAAAINAAILLVAACVFFHTEYQNITELNLAWKLLSPLLGFGLASFLFALALLAAGTNATITGTLAGQIAMEGFLGLRLKPWLRRLLTRGIAVLPVLLVLAFTGAAGQGAQVGRLLEDSQVVLSLQLPFAMAPLVWFVSSKRIMGVFRAPLHLSVLAWGIAAILIGLNLKLVFDAL